MILDIDSLKILIKEQSDTIKGLGLEIAKLKEKVTTNEETITRLGERVSSFLREFHHSGPSFEKWQI